MIDLSIIIPTRRRTESLTITLQDLARTERKGITVEVVVVENDLENRSESILVKFRDQFQLRYYLEPRLGKSYALNRALDEGVGGQIIAILDDDISVDVNWIKGVLAISQRWPAKGYYCGRVLIRWPEGPVPDWCKLGGLQGWAFSVLDRGLQAAEMSPGFWGTGNCFWFRSAILAAHRRFSHLEGIYSKTHMDLLEPRFMLQLTEEGLGGITAPDAVVWHRVQPELLDVQTLRIRAALCGRAFAEIRSRPIYKSIRLASVFYTQPLIVRGYCAWHWLKAWLVRCLTKSFPGSGQNTGRQIHAEYLMAYYGELLRLSFMRKNLAR